MNIFCPKKADLDVPGTRARLTEWMRRSYYWTTREWCDKNIKPRIIRASRDRAIQLTTDTFAPKWRPPRSP